MRKLLAIVRSTLFAVVLLVLTPLFAMIALCVSPCAPLTRYRVIGGWSHAVMWCVRHVLGIRWRIEGAENLPSQSSVILAKHMSAWETIAFQLIFPPQVYIYKRELFKVPFFGWGLAQMPSIAINRSSAREALNQVVKQGKQWLADGFWVVIFPEGTRIAPGQSGQYKPGGSLLANKAQVPAVPVAHNAGEFWARNAFIKYPGEIVVSIGQPILPSEGLSASEINAKAEAWIESEMQRLFPHHFQPK